MIASLQGQVIERNLNSIVLMVNGVGYDIGVRPDDLSFISNNEEILMYIAENIKEDTYDLYGFLQKSVKDLYLQLISVNGVGPKAAMAILSVDSEGEIRNAIASGNTALLSRANGVGKKVAERVVVDLKSKVGLAESSDATDFLRDDATVELDDAVQALVSLGYTQYDAKVVLSKVDKDLPTQERIKEALRGK